MASQADETSPPRSDLVVKTRRQSTLLDSPSRLTRSQSRRLSSAPLEAPMSPLPSVTTRRRSVRVSESLNDAASQDDVASVQDEAEPVKPLARSRRSTRRSFADTIDEEPVATRGTKLTSIEEDSKPVTRRTRASLKPQADTDQELSLPTTRRTRRSSVSSVTSVSTIASNVSPKGRRTRSQKNLSPVPSPSFSEASALSEIPEASPNAKKKSPLPAKEDGSLSNDVTPVSAVSPAKPSPMKSATPLESVKGVSPMSKRDRTSLSAPRQLQLEDSDVSKRASLNNATSEIDQTSQGNGFIVTSEDVADLKSRRSRRSSLTPSKFIESPLEDSSSIVQQRDACDASANSSREDQEVSEVSGQAELNSSRRKSSARNSLSKSPGPEEISHVADQPELNTSRRKSTGWRAPSKSPGPEEIDQIADQSELNSSKRKSSGRLSLSKSPGPEEISEVADQPELNSSKRKSTGRLSLSKSPDPDKPSEVAEQPEHTSFKRKSGERFSLSKSTDHVSPYKESAGRFSLSSVKSPALEKCSGESTLLSVKTPEPRKSLGDSIGKQLEFSEAAPEVEKMGRGSTGRVSLSSAKSPELDKSCKDSTSNVSSPSVKTPELERSQRYSGKFSKAQCFEVDESEETRRCSLTSVKSLDSEAPKRNSLSISPAKSANEHDSADQGSLACKASESPLQSDTSQRLSMSKSDQMLRKSFGRQSISSVKSSPGFTLKFNVTPLDDSGSGEEPSEENESGDGTESTSASSNLVVPNSALRRASTGNLALKKTIELENKSKQRASTGSVFSRSSMKLDDEVNVKEAMSNSLNSSKQSLGSLNDSSKIDEPELVASEELRLSPIKQDQSDFKRLTLTPSSSDDSYVEIVNNPLEKSTVFNDVSFDSQSAPSESSLAHEKPSEEHSLPKAATPNPSGAAKRASINEKVLDFLHGVDSGNQTSKSKRASIKRMSSAALDTQEADSDLEVVLDECTEPKRTSMKRKSFEVSTQADSDVEVVSEPSSKLKRTSLKRMSSEVLQISPVDSGDEVEAIETSESSSKSKTLCKSDKVYKAAARMLNGDVSDFNDTDSDDNQWQLVFSPATKSKKELRKERKQQKKAAKLAKKKSKDERLALMDSAQKANDQDVDVGACNEHEGQNVPVNTDTISSEIGVLSKNDVECVERKKRKSMDVELQSSAKKRKSLEKKNACLPLELGAPSVSSPDSIVVPQMSPEETLVNDDSHSSSEKKTKKKKQNCPDNLDEPEPNLLDGADKKKKKKKLKKILSEEVVGEEDLEDTDNTPVEKKLKKKALKTAQTESVEVKKKKKKLGSTTESEPTDEHDPGSHSSAEKKKKLNGIDGELVAKKKKKKLKNSEAGTVEKTKKMKDTEFEPLDTQNSANSENISSESKKKKKLKKQSSSVIPGSQENGTLGIDVDESTEVATKKLKKKKKKPLIEMPSSGNQIAEADIEASSDAASIRKKKKQKKEKNMINARAAVELVEAGAGSDSDDAPTSVSFASGKRAALYEMQAAAESVKKREQELEVVGRQKEMYRMERKREEKLAKMQKMEEKKKRQMQFEGFTNDGQSSKTYFTNDGIQKPQNSKAPKRLPVDVLESLSEQPVTELVKHSDGFKGKSDISAILKAKEEKLEKKKQEKRLALKLKKKKLRESDYIPLDVLGSTRFGVVPLRNVMLAKKIEQNKLAEEATNFRQQNLYGSRIRRTPISSMLAEKEKLKASGKHRLVACANSK